MHEITWGGSIYLATQSFYYSRVSNMSYSILCTEGTKPTPHFALSLSICFHSLPSWEFQTAIYLPHHLVVALATILGQMIGKTSYLKFMKIPKFVGFIIWVRFLSNLYKHDSSNRFYSSSMISLQFRCGFSSISIVLWILC